MSYEPYTIYEAGRASPVVLICDHASNTVPPDVGDLGLHDDDMSRHIAYDIGGAGVTRALADNMGAPAIFSNFSRLVIDPNRGEDDPTLVMRLYDGSVIPANRGVDFAERQRRIDAHHKPYHDALTKLTAARTAPVLISIHSFTPQLAGRPPRPWHIGVLYARDRRLADPLLARLQSETDICVGDNEPYAGDLPGDTMDRHGLRHNRPHVLIELRNDLISTHEGQVEWADRLAPILNDMLETAIY